MVSKPYKLYLIGVGYHTVAIIPAKDLYDATCKYLVRIGFTSIYTYFYSYLMTTAITFDNKLSSNSKYYFGAIDAITINHERVSISLQRVINCNDIFSHVDLRDISNPLFIKPTIKEARNCVGFDDAPECELRKFCI